MGDLYTAVEARIHAVLAEGRGVDGSLGSEAQTRAIAEGTFRRQTDNADLADPAFPGSSFDRGYVFRFNDAADTPSPNNPYSGPQFEGVTCTVTVGYIYGTAASAFVDARGSEVAATEVTRPDRRALSDGRRIKRALEFGPLRGSDTDPAIIMVTRGTTRWQDLGGGRSLGVTTLAMVLQHDESTAYGP